MIVSNNSIVSSKPGCASTFWFRVALRLHAKQIQWCCSLRECVMLTGCASVMHSVGDDNSQHSHCGWFLFFKCPNPPRTSACRSFTLYCRCSANWWSHDPSSSLVRVGGRFQRGRPGISLGAGICATAAVWRSPTFGFYAVMMNG
jgi:hypothetical protein